MSWPKNLAALRPVAGISNDLPAAEIAADAWSNGRNIHVRDGLAERAQGTQSVYVNPLAAQRNIINFQEGVTNYWAYASDQDVFVVEGSSHTKISPVGGFSQATEPNAITQDLFNGLLTWNNGLDDPHYWDGNIANQMVPLPGWIAADRAKSIRPYKFFLVAMNMDRAAGTYPEMVAWSDAASPGAMPGTWAPAADNQAGDTILSDTPGGLIDGLTLRSDFILYSQQSTHIMSFVGGQFVMAFRRLFITSGVLARNCVAEFQGRHYLLNDGDIVVHDGHTIQSLGDKRMRRFLFSQIDQQNYQSCFVVPYTAQKEIWFCFPEAGETIPTLALVYSTDDHVFGVRELPQVVHAAPGLVTDQLPNETWDADTQAWDADTTRWNEQGFVEAEDTLVLAVPDEVTPTDSQFLQVDVGDTFDGLPINAFVQKTDMHLGDPERVKFIKRIWPKVRAKDGAVIRCRVGTSMQPNSDISWTDYRPYTVGTDDKVDVFAQGRYLSVEFSSDGAEGWELPGFDIEFEPRGYH